MSVVITNPPRVGREIAESFAAFGVAAVHEAQGRTGLILADDDGVVVVPRTAAAAVLRQGEAREAKEAQTRARLQAGELGLDLYGMREKLAARGLAYRRADVES